MAKRVTIKQSDLEKLPKAIREDTEIMAMIHVILSTYTKLEATLGFDLVLETVKPEPTPEPEPAPDDAEIERIVSISHHGERMIKIRTVGCESWPKRDGKKVTQGRLYINGVYVDALRPDQFHGANKDLENAYGTDEHSLDVEQGERVKVVIKSYHGRATETFLWEWPFRRA